ncbi:hypothetical protein OMP38_10115 [Cohnella ginsengisoli]|uniref:Extracellular solute-binding protein n=1 Tax=Cohnella ginsengisoli TaxID=425004 RepID=A0A9X4KFV9_9BACL|nr:hypothetical protein [Cohnella ginsengisoli]MDG0791185.1 hypothetical protein [Cohnella ginsengisoli]
MDLVFTAGWDSFDKRVAAQEFLPLDSLLASEGAALKTAIDPAYLQASSRGGEVYAVPAQQLLAPSAGVLINKALAAKYHIDESKIKSLQDLDAVMQAVKKKSNRALKVAGTLEDMIRLTYREQVGEDSSTNIAVLVPNGGTKVVNAYTTPAMRSMFAIFARWKTERYLWEYDTSNMFTSQSLAIQQQTFAVVKPALDYQSVNFLGGTSGPWDAIRFTAPYLNKKKLDGRNDRDLGDFRTSRHGDAGALAALYRQGINSAARLGRGGCPLSKDRTRDNQTPSAL